MSVQFRLHPPNDSLIECNIALQPLAFIPEGQEGDSEAAEGSGDEDGQVLLGPAIRRRGGPYGSHHL